MLHAPVEMTLMARLETAPKIRVLIVEKHAAVRRALRKRLSATPDLDVIAAVPAPQAAMPFLEVDDAETCAGAPDVVLLGLQSGSDEELFATLEVVHQIGRCPAAIIVLAPYADEVEWLLLQQAGVTSYLLKYIDSSRLIQEIHSVAGARRPTVPVS